MRLLLTRPQPADDPLATMLRAAGHEVLQEPLLSIEPLPAGAIDATGLQAVVVTSSNALRTLDANAALAALPLYAVGAATAQAARDKGFTNIVAGDAGARQLINALMPQINPSDGAILYLRGEDVAFDVEGALKSAGICVDSRMVYRAVPAAGLSPETVAQLLNGRINGTILLSPRTAEIYLKLATETGLRPSLPSLTHFCLSARVAAPLIASGITQISVPARPDLQELVALIGVNATHSSPSA